MSKVNYHDFKNSDLISVDIETHDPDLKESGAGVYRRDGRIVGVSLADSSGFAEYYNVGHPGVSYEEKNKNYEYLRSVLSLPCSKLGANIAYDLDWLENWAGIHVCGKLHDVQIAEPLIDENSRSFSLQHLAQKYLQKGKETDEISAWCTSRGLSGDPRKHIHEMPYDVVRSYAVADALDPLAIFEKQKEVLKKENLTAVYTLERKLIRPLLAMRKNGARVDLEALEKAITELTEEIAEMEEALYSEYGKFSVNSTKQIADVFKKIGLDFKVKPTTGNPSITGDDLETNPHPIAQAILDVRRYKKTLSTFLVNSFKEKSVHGRIHTSFAQLKSDASGTVSGRFSSSKPNLQQIPSRHPRLGALCRSLIIPEPDCWLGKIDWSQIEYRIIAHYALGEKSEEVREQYRRDPTTDYHEFVMKLTGLDRKPAKNLNFGAAYFMGVNTCSIKFHWTKEQASELLATYHKKVPFVRTTGQQVSTVAAARGYINTISGRRARVTPEMRERKKTFIMFNRLIQGTAADIMKLAVVKAWESGTLEILKCHLTVHDELVVSIPKTLEGLKAFAKLKKIMETCVTLRVPILANAEIGKNWHDTEEFDIEKYKGRLK